MNEYELFIIDACKYDDGWVWNKSFYIRDVELDEGEEEEFLLGQVASERRKEYEVQEGRLYCEYELYNKTEDYQPVLALMPKCVWLPF